MEMVKLHSKNNSRAIFSVLLNDDYQVFMKCNRGYDPADSRAIVIIDTLKFLELWKADPGKDLHYLSHGSREAWMQDSKYPDMAQYFEFGLINPVPLASVNLYESNQKIKFLNFNDGVTRTLWLLAHGATAFPVECYSDFAKELSELAGCNPGEYFIVSDYLQ